MKPEGTNQATTVNHDEDIKFELEKEPAIGATEKEATKNVGETIIPAKEDTLGESDFPPLTESDKQPKLAEDK